MLKFKRRRFGAIEVLSWQTRTYANYQVTLEVSEIPSRDCVGAHCEKSQDDDLVCCRRT